MILVAIFVSLSFVVASLSEEAAVLGFKVGLRVVVADRAALFEGGFERVVEDYWNNESLPGGELALSSLLIIWFLVVLEPSIFFNFPRGINSSEDDVAAVVPFIYCFLASFKARIRCRLADY